jgi:hypothetical protein
MAASPLFSPAGHGRPACKGLDEACAWLRKAALTPFPPVTKSEQDYGHGRNKARTKAKLQIFFLFPTVKLFTTVTIFPDTTSCLPR